MKIMGERLEGKIKFYLTEKNYGFITYDFGDVFFHLTSLPLNYSPVGGEIVSFELKESSRGLTAINIHKIEVK